MSCNQYYIMHKVPIICFCTDKMYIKYSTKPYVIYICLFESQLSKTKLTKNLLPPLSSSQSFSSVWEVEWDHSEVWDFLLTQSILSKVLAIEALLRGFAAWNWRPAYSWLVSCEEQKLQTPPNRGNGIPGDSKVTPGWGLPESCSPTTLPPTRNLS